MLRNQVRIIGGKWRGKKLEFPNTLTLRPSLDRVRETLFNWLSPIIYNTTCLDLFAGSGALGFEALSRGASYVTFIDKNTKVIEYLKKNLSNLSCCDANIIHSDANFFLKDTAQKFDIIFLDPPFFQNLIQISLKIIDKRHIINLGGYIYVEMEAQGDLSSIQLPRQWTIKKHMQTKRIKSYLLAVSSAF